MTPQQVKTLKRLGVAVALLALVVCWLLYTEAAAVVQGGNSTISELCWKAWASQPGAVLGVLLPLACAVAFLFGHFFWQASSLYERMRGK